MFEDSLHFVLIIELKQVILMNEKVSRLVSLQMASVNSHLVHGYMNQCMLLQVKVFLSL